MSRTQLLVPYQKLVLLLSLHFVVYTYKPLSLLPGSGWVGKPNNQCSLQEARGGLSVHLQCTQREEQKVTGETASPHLSLRSVSVLILDQIDLIFLEKDSADGDRRDMRRGT